MQAEELNTMRLRLSRWIHYCSNAVEGLENIVTNAEKAIADAEANELKALNYFS